MLRLRQAQQPLNDANESPVHAGTYRSSRSVCFDQSTSVVCCAESPKQSLAKRAADTVAGAAASALIAGAAGAMTFDELQGLSYLQVKGTGVANACPTLAGGGDGSALKPGRYMVSGLCIEPTEFKVKEESQFKDGAPEFVATKLMTRLTYTLDGLSGKLTVGSGGDIEFVKDNEGIDFAPTTVQLPGGERVPFLFTFKQFSGKGTIDGFSGDFTVPSYRGSSFLDPKGRGGSTGYDTAVGLPAKGDADELLKENIKSTAALKGSAVFSVAKVDPTTGEIAGLFESVQPSDTDLGAKAPKDVKITGLWYGQLS